MCGLFAYFGACGSATEATASAAATITTTVTAAVAATATMTATTAGQTVDACAGRVRLAAGAHGLAVGQVQACKLCGFQWINVAWQFVAVVAAAVLTTLAALTTTGWATAFRTWTTRCGTALTVATVVKTHIAAWLLAAWTIVAAKITAAFTATIALAFKARRALWSIAA